VLSFLYFLVKGTAECGASSSQAALGRPDRDLEDLRNLGHRELRGEDQPEDLPMSAPEGTDRAGHVGHVGTLQRNELRSRNRGRLADQAAILDLPQPVASEPVSGLAAPDGDQPRTDARVAAECGSLTPYGEHRVLQDLLAEGSVTDDEEDLAQHDLTVPPVQLGQGTLVAGRDLPEESFIVPFSVGSDSTHGGGCLVRTVHQQPPGSTLHNQVSSNKRRRGSL
jgi:hypothetical protein